MIIIVGIVVVLLFGLVLVRVVGSNRVPAQVLNGVGEGGFGSPAGEGSGIGSNYVITTTPTPRSNSFFSRFFGPPNSMGFRGSLAGPAPNSGPTGSTGGERTSGFLTSTYTFLSRLFFGVAPTPPTSRRSREYNKPDRRGGLRRWLSR